MIVKDPVKYADDPKRDKSKVLTCDFCKSNFYPRKGAIAPRFCSQECTRKGSWGAYGSLGLNKK